MRKYKAKTTQMHKVICSSLLLMFVALLITSCTFAPAYRATKIDYCERIRGKVICPDGLVYDAGYRDRGIYE